MTTYRAAVMSAAFWRRKDGHRTSVPGHSRRFVRVRATSGYPPELAV